MIADNKITTKGLVVWFVCAFFFMYEFLLRTVLGTFQFPLMQDLHLTPVSFALLSSTAYQLIYGTMQLPVGIITDRFGLKKTLLAAVLFCAAANLGFAFSTEFSTAAVFRVLMGFGSSFGFVCLLVAVYDWMPRKNIALFIGISQFIGTLGPMLAAGPFNVLSQNNAVSWRSIFIVLSGIGFLIALLVLFFVEKNRQNQGKFIILSRPSAIGSNLLRIICQRQTWFVALYSACVYFSIEYLSENEGVEFLVKKGFSSTLSSYMITLAWLGYAVGCPLLGFLSDQFQRRKPVMVVSSLCALFALVGIIYLPLGRFATSTCFVFLGIGASGQSIGFAAMAEQCREDYLAVGLAFNNAIIMLLAAINAPVIGWILARLAHIYPMRFANYQLGFLVMIGLVTAAMVLAATAIKETFCKSARENTLLHPKEY
ncbi:MFS transporter [Legionella londiniensis]|uniref:Lysosomal dipeptide transporter MFSD1 n=1 Tax=Legionella londiniensis TaxID=45068 RepID=A0A0W0VND8_9GAMM|nr:MFS transporter [Legionella londiniensis]KTD21599.1 major facilitator superfamily (MFS) transporter [Legionella londiniensis]STX93370.1 major facilitator superfamily (MFS) transporter [Legionella londiniensis]